ncbi:DNA-binding response regulator, partial [Arthrobacter stackebrandtii]
MRAKTPNPGEVLSMVGRNILIVDDEAPIREMIAVA